MRALGDAHGIADVAGCDRRRRGPRLARLRGAPANTLTACGCTKSNRSQRVRASGWSALHWTNGSGASASPCSRCLNDALIWSGSEVVACRRSASAPARARQCQDPACLTVCGHTVPMWTTAGPWSSASIKSAAPACMRAPPCKAGAVI